METLVIIEPNHPGLFYEVTHGLNIVTYKDVAMPENFWTEFGLSHTEVEFFHRVKYSTSPSRTFIILGGDDAVEIAKDLVVRVSKKYKRVWKRKKEITESNFNEISREIIKGVATIEAIATAFEDAAMPQAIKVAVVDALLARDDANARFGDADRYLNNLVYASDSEEDAKREIELLKRFFSLQIGCKT